MPSIIFIETTTNKRHLTMCQLAEFAYEKGKRVKIMVKSANEAIKLNSTLWTFSPNSFVPHSVLLSNEETQKNDPVTICKINEVIDDGDVIITCEKVDLSKIDTAEIAFHLVILDNEKYRESSRILWQETKEMRIKLKHVKESNYQSDKISEIIK